MNQENNEGTIKMNGEEDVVDFEQIGYEFGNPHIAVGTFGKVSIGIKKSNTAYSYIAFKSITNAYTFASTNHTHGNDHGNDHDNDGGQTSNDNVKHDGRQLSLPVFMELTALRTLSMTHAHENITPLLSTESHESCGITFIFPYCPIDLHQIIQHGRFHNQYNNNNSNNNNTSSSSGSALKPSAIRTIFRDILHGLHHCHAHGIIHCDVKPGNILCTTRGIFQLADFGLAQMEPQLLKKLKSEYNYDNDHQRNPIMSMKATGLCTLPYRPPELLFGIQPHEYTSAMDIWGAGLILTEMLNGRPLFYGTSVLDQLGRIMDVLGTPNKENWHDIHELPDYGKVIFDKRDGGGVGLKMMVNPMADDTCLERLIEGMVVMNPSSRLNAQECLQHDWMMNNVMDCHSDSDHSRQSLVEEVVPDEFLPSHYSRDEGNESCTVRMTVFDQSTRDNLLEQMKLKGVAIALAKRKASNVQNISSCEVRSRVDSNTQGVVGQEKMLLASRTRHLSVLLSSAMQQKE